MTTQPGGEPVRDQPVRDAAAEARSRRRAAAKRHHPDLGGDPAEFDRAMREADAVGVARPRTTHEIVVVPSPRTRARRALRQTKNVVSTRVVSHLPFAMSTRLGQLARLTRRSS